MSLKKFLYSSEFASNKVPTAKHLFIRFAKELFEVLAKSILTPVWLELIRLSAKMFVE